MNSVFWIHDANIYKSGLLYYGAVGRRPDGGSHGWQPWLVMNGTPTLAEDVFVKRIIWKRIDTSKCNCTITGLESGMKYWVRVGVIASNFEKLWGDAILSPYIP